MREGAREQLQGPSLKLHNAFAAEVYVMAVRREWHRQDAGRGLMQAAEDYLRVLDVRHLQVKTLGPSAPDLNYA